MTPTQPTATTTEVSEDDLAAIREFAAAQSIYKPSSLAHSLFVRSVCSVAKAWIEEQAALSTAPSGDGATLASKDAALAEIRADRDAVYKMLVIANAQLADMEFLSVEGFMGWKQDRASRATSTHEGDTK